jgi:hypothetical protein
LIEINSGSIWTGLAQIAADASFGLDVLVCCAPIFGVVSMTIEQFEEWSLVIGVGGLVLFMVFIVWSLGRESKAGKFGMFVLFLALALGLLGFVIKLVLVEMLQP